MEYETRTTTTNLKRKRKLKKKAKCKIRPFNDTQKKWIEQEQRNRSLALENYALTAAANLFQEQINIQNQLIQALIKSNNDVIRVRRNNIEEENDEDDETETQHEEVDESSEAENHQTKNHDSIKLIDVSEELDQPEFYTQQLNQSVKDIIEDDSSFFTLQPSQSLNIRPSSISSSLRKKPEHHVSISDMSRILRPPSSAREKYEAIKSQQQRRRPLTARPDNQMEPKSDFDLVMNRLKSRIANANQRNETPSAILLNRRRMQFRL